MSKCSLGMLLAACATGLLTFLSFPEFDLTILAWICLLPLRYALRRQGLSGARAFVWGWVAGLVANLGGFFWIIHLLRVFGHMSWPPALLIYLLLCAYQGLVYAVWAAGSTLLSSRLPRVPAPLIDALVFTAAEQLLPFLFPWYLGSSQYLFPLVIQVVEITGVQGLSFLLAFSSSSLASCLASRGGWPRSLWPLVPVAALVLADLGYGASRIGQVELAIQAAPRLRVAMVEGDIGIREKGRTGRAATNLAIYQHLSVLAARRGAQLIVWPETVYNLRRIPVTTGAIPPAATPLWPDERFKRLEALPGDHLVIPDIPLPLDPQKDEEARVSRRDRMALQRGFRVPLLAGAITWEPEPDPPAPGRRWRRRHYNSAILLDEQGVLAGRIQHKNKLLVFGEYLPLGRTFPRLHEWFPRASSYASGSEARVLVLKELRVALLNCYEAILPRFANRFTDPRPNLLVSIANDAWFGTRGEPWMHMALSTMRSVEQRTAMVRATNTGVSAFVDPCGRIIDHSDVMHAEVMLAELPLMDQETVFRRVGELFAWASVAATLLLGVLALHRISAARRD